jgi:hypothetical protein
MNQINKYRKLGIYICYFPFLDKGEYAYRFYFHDINNHKIVNDVNDRWNNFDEGVKIMCSKVKEYIKNGS